MQIELWLTRRILYAALHAWRGAGNIVEHLIANERGQCMDANPWAILGIRCAGDRIQQAGEEAARQ